MIRRAPLVAVIFAAGWALARAGEPERGVLMPPDPPRHEQRTLDTASDLARDFAQTVAYLEMGQSYFKAYKRTTHSKVENTAMLKFLETYERERDTARREHTVLTQWVRERSDLELKRQ